ncbi:helix-turn-helix transcriptional regulator [Microbacterium sp. NIBRBAC000506063]|uniref:helix-turn-helix transcriptional regulator n=1 Tax=Microbacterium sp. NIBRBAC000506063 TaxID=2734618 RepID=UPI001BB50048|nr:helix-turn-helix transcriptional regulator [Microbacterium sp. NIBRBAC000506063]
MTNSPTRLEILGKSIKRAREDQDLTQSQLAKRADTSRLSVLRIEQGSHVNTDTLVKVVGALGLEIKLLESGE